jgi:hypothetical protein
MDLEVKERLWKDDGLNSMISLIISSGNTCVRERGKEKLNISGVITSDIVIFDNEFIEIINFTCVELVNKYIPYV